MKRFTLVLVLLALGGPRDTLAAEICGNGVDDDTDLMADEGCNPAAITGVCENPLDCSTTGTVAPKSGNVVYHLPPDIDVEVPFGPALTFQRFYASLYEPGGSAPAYRKSLGPHWGHNFMSWLDFNSSPNPDQVIVHTVDGNDVLFQYDSTAGGYKYFVAQEGYHVDYLRQKSSSGVWELRTLSGMVYEYNWSSPVGKLTSIKDTLSTPNTLTITYNGSGLIDKVVDASAKKQLVFTYNGSSLLTDVDYQTVDGGTPTTRIAVDFAYTGSNPITVTIASQLRQTLAYNGSGYLTSVRSGTGNDPVQLALDYLSSTPGVVVRSTSPLGDLGFEYNSSRASCSGGSIVYFNRNDSTSCDDDTDCGSDFMCGGETNFAGTNTGVCYRAARCLTLTSPDEDLVDTVAGIAASGGSCTGACAETTEYDWGSTPDLAGVKQADGTWTSYQRNSDGLVTLTAIGDTDSDPTNTGGQKTWSFFGNSTFPGRLTETRKLSELKPSGTCNGTTTTDCARTIYTWNSNGLLGSRQDVGFTLDTSGATVSYSYTTAYTYDSKGRLTQVDGPLSGTNDVTDYTYWTSTDVLKDGYRKEIKRKKDATNYLVTTLDSHNFLGKATSQQDPDGTFTCFTYSSFGPLTVQRVAMAGQTSCGTSDSSDLTTTYTYDAWNRITQTQRPLGNCEHVAYDVQARLTSIKERDDCNTESSGDTIEYVYSTGTNPVVERDQVMSVFVKDGSGATKREYAYDYHDGMQLAQDINPVNKNGSNGFTYTADGLLSQVQFDVVGASTLSKTAFTWDSLDREDQLDRYKTSSTFDDWDSTYGAQGRRPIQVEDDDAKSLYTTWDDLRRKVKTVSPDSGTTLFVFDAAGRMTTKVEADGLSGEVSHSFTYDNLDRRLTEDYGTENCGSGQPVEVQYVYDTAPSSCPTGAVCTNTAGRLAYIKSTLLCSASYGDNALNQEVFYGYDADGRLINEWIQDDSTRTAEQLYTWDKNGNAIDTTAPSGTVSHLIRGSTASNSNTDKVTELSNGTSTFAEPVAWNPDGPIASYTQRNQSAEGTIRAALTWNAAYRPSEVKYWDTVLTQHKLNYTEDAKGRTTLRDYTNGDASLDDSHIQYDWLDRIVCDAAVSGSCPTTSPDLRNNLNGSPPYTASSDRTQLLHYNPSYGTYTYSYTLRSGKDQIDYFTTSPSTGTTTFGWDDRGNRTSDDSNSYSHDARNYTYEGRRLVRQITGQRQGGCMAGGSNWSNFTITNAFDDKGRRVFKSYDCNTVHRQWFFYYNLRDQLIEVKYTPDISSPSTYSLFNFWWIEDRPILYYQVDYPSVTTTRRYLDSDAENRVIEAWSWPTSGTSTRVWALNPDAFGWDEILVGSGIFQPLRGVDSMDFYEAESRAQNDSGADLRPELHLTPRGYYDPLAAAVLQVDPTVSSVMSYSYGAKSLLVDGTRALSDLSSPSGVAERVKCGNVVKCTVTRWFLLTMLANAVGNDEQLECVNECYSDFKDNTAWCSSDEGIDTYSDRLMGGWNQCMWLEQWEFESCAEDTCGIDPAYFEGIW